MSSISSSSVGMKRDATTAGLTEEQKARYDRQIRVWGSEAQERIQNCKVLICGLRGINAEVVKNVVLAGMNVCIQDSGKVSTADLASGGFFLNAEDVGKDMVDVAIPRIQELNSMSNVTSTKTSSLQLNDEYT